ncbi:hypothetical protein WN48_05861 [Eufriesea mexicana]|uniref:Uncharacterized protein n=1 Tax=Eufriesea mexicana TaxID=516756 RepID=A0A310SK78_9HYME|nr:hypothetical protein WN48_05861 [Eufriesea mexicana]
MKNGARKCERRNAAREGCFTSVSSSHARISVGPDKPAVRDPSACVIPPGQRVSERKRVTEKESQQRIDRTACCDVAEETTRTKFLCSVVIALIRSEVDDICLQIINFEDLSSQPPPQSTIPPASQTNNRLVTRSSTSEPKNGGFKGPEMKGIVGVVEKLEILAMVVVEKSDTETGTVLRAVYKWFQNFGLASRWNPQVLDPRQASVS